MLKYEEVTSIQLNTFILLKPKLCTGITERHTSPILSEQAKKQLLESMATILCISLSVRAIVTVFMFS